MGSPAPRMVGSFKGKDAAQAPSMEKRVTRILDDIHRLAVSPYQALKPEERKAMQLTAAVLVTGCRSIIAASYVVLALLVALRPTPTAAVQCLWAWSGAEVCFHLAMLFRARFVLDRILPYTRPTQAAGLATTEEICRSAPRLEEVFGSWHRSDPMDLAEFNSWLAFYWFYKRPDQLSREETAELLAVQAKFEDIFSIKLRHLPFAERAGLRPLIEPVPFQCKPLFVYLVSVHVAPANGRSPAACTWRPTSPFARCSSGSGRSPATPSRTGSSPAPPPRPPSSSCTGWGWGG